MRRTLRTELPVFAATAVWTIPTARRIWDLLSGHGGDHHSPAPGAASDRGAHGMSLNSGLVTGQEFPEEKESEFPEAAWRGWREQVGLAVGHHYPNRRSYIKGSSRRRLPELLSRLGQIDLFVSR
jgi:hypothetical protein